MLLDTHPIPSYLNFMYEMKGQSHAVSTKTDVYNDRYISGRFVSLADRVAQLFPDRRFKDTREMFFYAKDHLSLDVKRDKDGALGIEVLNENTGYSFKRGIKDSSNFTSVESFDEGHEDFALEAHAALLETNTASFEGISDRIRGKENVPVPQEWQWLSLIHI